MNYYKVGEEVLAYSTHYPETHGAEVTVVGISGSSYIVSPNPLPVEKHDDLPDGKQWSGAFYQSSLRKKHKPSTKSFEELMESTLIAQREK